MNKCFVGNLFSFLVNFNLLKSVANFKSYIKNIQPNFFLQIFDSFLVDVKTVYFSTEIGPLRMDNVPAKCDSNSSSNFSVILTLKKVFKIATKTRTFFAFLTKRLKKRLVGQLFGRMVMQLVPQELLSLKMDLHLWLYTQ